MPERVEVTSVVGDARASVLQKKITALGFDVSKVTVTDVYTAEGNLEAIAELVTNPVTERVTIGRRTPENKFDHAIEIGFLPGVTDNVGSTVSDLAGTEVHFSKLITLSGDITEDDAQEIGEELANPLIQRIEIKPYEQFAEDEGMDAVMPRVHLTTAPTADIVHIIEQDDDELTKIGKQGVPNQDGTRRGPLALDLTYMHTIRDYFKKEKRNPTDVELESIAQTWSEHCKHTIFADPIDDITDGLYKHFIQRATNEIRKKKGDKDFCVSVFTDNSGAIIFDDDWLITDKVETHNSPSALGPFGGAITGIVGVDRDALGFGLGAKPVAHRYGFCFCDPDDKKPLYKGKNKTQKMLSPRRIMDGVIDGVNVGGNCSGIPTTQGFVNFDDRYKGKPLVFVGTVGLIPRKINGQLSHKKAALAGDHIVVIGGKVGQDGIHGATFSSESLDEGSPATAVQIGDPITQKKLSDALMEARGLYNSITDNGAGGLSCSVAEMAKECGGFEVILDDVPLKYPGLEPWKIWISESQERMTLAVPEDKIEEFQALMKSRDVESTVIGEFNDGDRAKVSYNDETVMDLEMGFLHDGLPKRPMTTKEVHVTHENPEIEKLEDLTDTFHNMLARKNIASFEFISEQYDHEVQGGSVLKPLQGRGRVNADATAIKPVLESEKAVVMSQGITPQYSDIDTYAMAAASIDTAVRAAIAAGANPDHVAIMDNFCWCSSNDPERLWQLKRAVEACYDVATAYETPFISGKDSMFNDFKGFDENGDPIEISIPPTLLASAISVVDDATKTVSLDAKCEGDMVYVLGETADELGGSEYFAMHDAIGERVPQVNTEVNNRVYRALAGAIQKELVASSQSVGRGGLGVALAKTAMGGKLGMDINLSELTTTRNDYTLFSESQGRIVVTIDPERRTEFEEAMADTPLSCIGTVTAEGFKITADSKTVVNTTIDSMLQSYRKTFEGY